MTKKTKQFKCSECKNWISQFKVEPATKRLVDTRKYYKTKIVCGRCFHRLKENDRMNRLGIKNAMVGLIWAK